MPFPEIGNTGGRGGERERGKIMLSIFECPALVPVGHAGSWAKAETNEKLQPRNVTFGT